MVWNQFSNYHKWVVYTHHLGFSDRLTISSLIFINNAQSVKPVSRTTGDAINQLFQGVWGHTLNTAPHYIAMYFINNKSILILNSKQSNSGAVGVVELKLGQLYTYCSSGNQLVSSAFT